VRSKAHSGDPGDSLRLHKALAQAGLGSRRAMETWIAAGRVLLNGKVAQIGARLGAGDKVSVDGREVRLAPVEAAARVLIYHKPEGEIVTRDDPQGRETVFTRLPRLSGARWVSVGRLDVATSGLLIFTTSGALANRMTHPRFEVEREYAARIFGQLTEDKARGLMQGIELDDGLAKFDKLADEGGEGSNHWYRLVVTEGRNRLVRRLFEAAGYTVSRLMRVRFGMVSLPPRLKRGQIEELPPDQVRRLERWAMGEERPARKPASNSSRVKTNTQSSPPEVSGHKKGRRGQARSTRSRA
jgi:23S rRNA pseudouridine2605 synthase